jgi:hypothetical protein
MSFGDKANGAQRSETRSGTRCGEVLRYEGSLLETRGGSGGEGRWPAVVDF